MKILRYILQFPAQWMILTIAFSLDAASSEPWPDLVSDETLTIYWISTESEIAGLATRTGRVITDQDDNDLAHWLKTNLPSSMDLEPLVLAFEDRSLIAWLAPPFIISLQLKHEGLQREGLIGISHLDKAPTATPVLEPYQFDFPPLSKIVFHQHESLDLKTATTLTINNPLPVKVLRKQVVERARANGWQQAGVSPSPNNPTLTLLRPGRKRFMVFMNARDGPGTQVILVEEHYTRF